MIEYDRVAVYGFYGLSTRWTFFLFLSGAPTWFVSTLEAFELRLRRQNHGLPCTSFLMLWVTIHLMIIKQVQRPSGGVFFFLSYFNNFFSEVFVSWQCTISTDGMCLQAKSHMSHLENGSGVALQPRQLYLNGQFTAMENPARCSENVGRKHKLGRLDTGGFPLWSVCPAHSLIHNLVLA